MEVILIILLIIVIVAGFMWIVAEDNGSMDHDEFE